MSDIPVGRRKESRLQAQIEAYKVRDVMTVELFRNFGVNEKKLDAFIEKQTAHIKDEELKKREQEAIRKRIESAIEDERKTISDLSRGITGHLRAANTIYPEIWEEYVERRVQLDKAMEYCNRLQDELQYIATAIPTDKNKYTNIVLHIDKVFNLTKKLRGSDKRLISKIPDVPPKVLEEYNKSRKKK